MHTCAFAGKEGIMPKANGVRYQGFTCAVIEDCCDADLDPTPNQTVTPLRFDPNFTIEDTRTRTRRPKCPKATSHTPGTHANWKQFVRLNQMRTSSVSSPV